MIKPSLGIIGGGQLGSMLCSAAKKINIKTILLSDDIDAPAQNFCNEFIFGKYDNEEIINEFVNKVDLVTFEFENIPYEILNKINIKKNVLPKPEVNKIIQDRFTEKNFINECNISTTNYVLIESKNDLKSNSNLFPGILKTRRFGYDGKGQYKINSIDDLNNIILDSNKKYILEQLVKIKKEISVIITRFDNQKYEIYEPIENVHHNQILKHSKIPSDINKKIYDKSVSCAILIAEKLNYIGTLCVEYFIDNSDNLLVNEIAPRVHNSGHLTINTHNVSQFENHVRAVCGLENVKLEKIFNGEMINLIGKDILIYRNKRTKKNEFFFDYLKKDIKEKRKMGHITKIKNL